MGDDVAGDLVGLGEALEPHALPAGVVQPAAQQADALGALHPDEDVGVRELQRLQRHVVVQDLDQPTPAAATGPDQVGARPPDDPDGRTRPPGADRAYLLGVPPRADQDGVAGHGHRQRLPDAGIGTGRRAVPWRRCMGGDVQGPPVAAHHGAAADGRRRGAKRDHRGQPGREQHLHPSTSVSCGPGRLIGQRREPHRRAGPGVEERGWSGDREGLSPARRRPRRPGGRRWSGPPPRSRPRP